MHFLKDRNIPCVTLNKQTDTHERRVNTRKFLSGEVNVLSCTDLVRLEMLKCFPVLSKEN